MILKGLRTGSRMRPEQDSVRSAKSEEGYENMEAWGWESGVLALMVP